MKKEYVIAIVVGVIALGLAVYFLVIKKKPITVPPPIINKSAEIKVKLPIKNENAQSYLNETFTKEELLLIRNWMINYTMEWSTDEMKQVLDAVYQIEQHEGKKMNSLTKNSFFKDELILIYQNNE